MIECGEGDQLRDALTFFFRPPSTHPLCAGDFLAHFLRFSVEQFSRLDGEQVKHHWLLSAAVDLR